MLKFKIPEVTIERFPIYLRSMNNLPDNFILSSNKIAKVAGTTANQVRKDLSYLGRLGIRGKGYKIGKLKKEIIRILNIDRKWKIAIVGVGKLGSALLAYPGLKKGKFQIKLAFDNDPLKIGKTIEKITVQNAEKIPELLPLHNVKIGIITTPPEVAQDVADKLIKGKVRGILNFAPVQLTAPKRIKVKNIDMSILLETISYFITQEEFILTGYTASVLSSGGK
ncbi:redox-sensing transcriptional repressor Rex [Candidatus Aerophobetes bacterium]|nr:redox-sensing transcriptional repressor Rex [Candidatus Aerophobetes bacterium]